MLARGVTEHQVALLPWDAWIDQVNLDTSQGTALRLRMYSRYCKSEYHGHEWRHTYGWEVNVSHAKVFGLYRIEDVDGWLHFEEWYESLEVGCGALYPALFPYVMAARSRELTITDIVFLRKGRELLRVAHQDDAATIVHYRLPLPLPAAAGHLHYLLSLMDLRAEPLGTEDAWRDMDVLCYQPGCPFQACSTYSLIRVPEPPVPMIRRFCPRHLRRGNVDKEDSDANYVVLEGPGPEDVRES